MTAKNIRRRLLANFLEQTFLLSDPNYSLWHQVRFQNVKAENAIFGRFRNLTVIITVFLSFVKIFYNNSGTPRHRLHTLTSIPIPKCQS